MNNVIILKSNSLLNLYQALVTSSWAFSPRKKENDDKAMFGWIVKNIQPGNFVLGFSTEENNSGFLLYGVIRTIPKYEKTINNPWDGQFLFPFKIDWNFIKPRAQLILRDQTKSFIEDMRGGHFPKQITHEQFLQILEL